MSGEMRDDQRSQSGGRTGTAGMWRWQRERRRKGVAFNGRPVREIALVYCKRVQYRRMLIVYGFLESIRVSCNELVLMSNVSFILFI